MNRTDPGHAAEIAAPFPELEEATIADLRRLIDAGERTVQALVAMYLDRIEALDRRGPALRAVLERNPDALETAAALDRERGRSD